MTDVLAHTYTPPATVVDILRKHGWPTAPTLDDIEVAGKVFGEPVAGWSHRIIGALNQTMPKTTGVGYLDDESHLVGVGLTAGGCAGVQTRHVVTGLTREDACFTLRALGQGYTRVRPMPLPPVAVLDIISGQALDGTRLGLVAAGTDTSPKIPDGARVFAEVDPAHREVVYDVWAVAPSTAPGGLGIWRRNDGQWVDDPGFLATLRGESPPTLLYLDPASPVLVDVLSQVDASTAGKPFQPLAASITLSPEIYTDLMPLIARGARSTLTRATGGKGGNAETLRRYWAEGEGAAKIRWGVGGDWSRCLKHLRKYMGVRAKGYCNLLHKRALGYYPSTHAKMEKAAH